MGQESLQVYFLSWTALGMQCSGGLKGTFSAGTGLCSFLDFLRLVADESSGNV